MKKKKINLPDLNVSTFKTSIDKPETETIKGGNFGSLLYYSDCCPPTYLVSRPCNICA